MEQPLISVIVPVYKTEQYLEKCINSIRNQTYRNLEIILIDDGSPDRCGEICDSFSKIDSRIRVFHKKNGGQSSARNMGLDHMNGEYVAFVDSDDWIEDEMYNHLYLNLINAKAQISCCGIQKNYLDGRVNFFNPVYPKDVSIHVYNKIDALKQSMINTCITYSPCDKLYHKSIFQGLRMTVGKIYEDMELIPKCIERAEQVVYDPTPYYHYTMTLESTIRGEFNIARFREVDIALEKAEDYKARYPELYNQAMGCYITACLEVIYASKKVKSCVQRRNELICKLQTSLPKSAICTMRRNDQIKLRLFRIHPVLFELLMLIIRN